MIYGPVAQLGERANTLNNVYSVLKTVLLGRRLSSKRGGYGFEPHQVH